MIKLLFIMLVTTACASNSFKRVTSASHDAFLAETTMRFDGKRLTEWAQSYGVLGEITRLCQQGETSLAQDKLKTMLNQERKNAGYWLVVANCYWHGKEGAKAEYFYKLGLSLVGTQTFLQAAFHNNLGVLYMQRQLYPEARTWLELAPNSLTARYNLAQIALLMGNARKAKELLGEIYRINRRDPDVLASLAVAHLLENNTKLAHKILTEIPKEEQARSDIAFYRAMAHYLQGNLEQAAIELKSANQTANGLEQISGMAQTLERLVEQEIERLKTAQKV